MRRSFALLAMCVALMMWAAPGRVMGEEKEKEEANEQKVKFDQVPEAVKTTLTEEAKGAKIETVDKETDEGKTIYEADVVIKGKNYEIKVAEDGTLVSKKLDAEEGKDSKKESDEKDEKDEKNEKK